MHKNLLNTYNPLPINIIRGEGVWLFDDKGNKYLDAICGIGVTSLGHNYPAVTTAIQQQATSILHASNLVQVPLQEQLAENLATALNYDCQAFFCNSGAEAVEAAIKFARLYGHSKNIDEPQILVMDGGFHGRTMATISAGSNPKIKAGFEPMMSGFIHVDFDDISAIEQHSSNKNIAAILLEPIQGEGGIKIPKPGYLAAVREICNKNEWLMLVDEVQSGMARSGKLLAYQHENISPDGITLAKALGNGAPIGALLVESKHGSLFKPGSHGSTFGGNYLSCSAALATLNAIVKHKLWENALEQGTFILNNLTQKLSNHPNVKSVRGKGLMLGIELDIPCRKILDIAIKNHIIFNIARDTTIRLLPPLIISQQHSNLIIETIPKIIDSFYS